MSVQTAICQSQLPIIPWTDPFLDRLPGLKPIALEDWITRDDAFDRQMARRDDLLQRSPETVLQLTDHGQAAAGELLYMVTSALRGRPGYCLLPDAITRPDGVTVPLHEHTPLATLGRLLQEDLLLLMHDGREHRLVGGVLCFPAFWSLRQKMGRSLLHAHDPVEKYDTRMGNRVERLLCSLDVDRAIMRANYLIYTDPELHQPAMEGRTRTIDPQSPRYVRVGRQTLRRLPETRALVFAIHTYLVPATTLNRVSYEALAERRPELRAT